MKCPNCGSENSAEALTCGLCQVVLRIESAPPSPEAAQAPPAAEALPPAMPEASTIPLLPSGEPVTLGSTAEIAILLSAADTMGENGHYEEAERMISRLFLEADQKFCAQFLASTGMDWLKKAKLGPSDESTYEVIVTAIATCVYNGQLDIVMKQCEAVVKEVSDATVEGARFSRLLLGLKGASQRKRL